MMTLGDVIGMGLIGLLLHEFCSGWLEAAASNRESSALEDRVRKLEGGKE